MQKLFSQKSTDIPKLGTYDNPLRDMNNANNIPDKKVDDYKMSASNLTEDTKYLGKCFTCDASILDKL